jgi:hypothetical protein
VRGRKKRIFTRPAPSVRAPAEDGFGKDENTTDAFHQAPLTLSEEENEEKEW